MAQCLFFVQAWEPEIRPQTYGSRQGVQKQTGPRDLATKQSGQTSDLQVQ